MCGGVKWPRDAACALGLSFDVDGESVPFVFDPDGGARRLALLSEWTYGPVIAVPRILDLLARYELPATFFVPGFTAELHPDLLHRIVTEGHEVGHHGYFHEPVGSMSDGREEEILEHGVEVIERVTGRRPRGYRAPGGEIKASTPARLLRHGFDYDTSLMGHHEPYWVQVADARILEIPWHWASDDFAHFAFIQNPTIGTGISAPSRVFDIWVDELAAHRALGACHVLVMHPSIIGRPSRLLMLERFFQHVRNQDDIWTATHAAIAAHAITGDDVVTIEVDRRTISRGGVPHRPPFPAEPTNWNADQELTRHENPSGPAKECS